MPSLASPASDLLRADRLHEVPLRVFYGHHKCATAWIDGILREVCLHLGIRFKIVHLPKHFEAVGSLGRLVAQERLDVLAYTNADAAHVADLPAHRGFHVVRDPRDIWVSAYFSHRHSHSTKGWPELEHHRRELQRLSKEEGLFRELAFSRPTFEEMQSWDYTQDHVLELKMEGLTADPLTGFVRILTWLDLLEKQGEGVHPVRTATLRLNRLNHRGRRFMPGNLPVFPVPRRRLARIPRSELGRILRQRSFARLTGGRKRGTENVKSHYRKGTPGDWRNHLSEAHIRAFKERYGDLLVTLGYETSPDWYLP
ncbi:MAG: sulfotransferase [Rhodothermaceae bacterium]|nr:sulfotransferase [Rhodothermaceae bacterium]